MNYFITCSQKFFSCCEVYTIGRDVQENCAFSKNVQNFTTFSSPSLGCYWLVSQWGDLCKLHAETSCDNGDLSFMHGQNRSVYNTLDFVFRLAQLIEFHKEPAMEIAQVLLFFFHPLFYHHLSSQSFVLLLGALIFFVPSVYVVLRIN